MKIVCLTHYYIEDNRAGGELMLHELLKALAAAGHDVTAFITDTDLPDTSIDGVKVAYDVDPRTVLDGIEYDVILSQFQNLPFAVEDSRRRGKPIVAIMHNDMWHTTKVLRMLKPTDLALYNTEWIKAACSTPAQEIVVHPPIDAKAFRTNTKGEYVTLVNLTKPKGVDVFTELAKRMPEVKFLGVKGGYWKADQQRISLPNVTIIENTPDMKRDVYAKSRVVLMPSLYETFGMVAAEACVSGIPVIAAPTAGLKENLGDSGIFVRRGSNDIDKWEAALRRLLTDQDYYKTMSKKARARSKHFDSTAELAAFVQTVEGLVNAKA